MSKSPTATPVNWRNRIVRYGEMPADQFTAHPNNPRRHPQAQRDAVKGSLDTLGWIAPVIVNVNSGFIVDGHERVMQALDRGDNTLVPFIEVRLTDEEEALALGSFDYITSLAYYDKGALDELLGGIHTDSTALQSLLSDLANQQGLYDASLPSPDDLLEEHGDYDPDVFTVKVAFDISRETLARFKALKKAHNITDDNQMFEKIVEGYEDLLGGRERGQL